MTLDEAIKHCEEVAKEKEYEYQERIAFCDMENAIVCAECETEHKQLAKWLRDYKRLLDQTKWIHVSERLPQESMTVVGITEFDDIYKAELYDDCGEKKWYADGNFDVPIVAWMPMPELHKEESED